MVSTSNWCHYPSYAGLARDCNCYLPTLCALYFDVWGGSCARYPDTSDSGEQIRASNEHSRSLKFYNQSQFKVASTTFTFKTLLRRHAKQALLTYGKLI